MGYSRPPRPSLQGSNFDLAIIGGGINGVAIARECGLAGRRVLLVEQADFASGTTSRATRIIHGGLRYLEHGEIGLVRESLRERERLLKERPHLVHPLDFVLALPTHGVRRSALAIRVGIWLYRQAARSHVSTASRDLAALESNLDRGLNLSLFPYEDAQCEYPERLVAEWLAEAGEAGAVVRNYTAALEIVTHEGKAHGLLLRDSLTNEESEITADWIVNAAGPWADEILSSSQLEQKRMIGGVRGSHIVVPIFAGALEQALYTEAADRRPVFVIPWAGQILIGTTEVPQEESPDRAEPSAAEIEYLLASARRLFPRAAIGKSDIRYSYAGVRPLPFSPHESLSAISRRHFLHHHLEDGTAGLITVVGGKLTTAASLARDCARMMGIKVPDARATLATISRSLDLVNVLEQWSKSVALLGHIPVATASAIVEWHGRRAEAVACLAAQDEALRRPLCAHSEHIVAEAVSAMQHESAVRLGDILLRRVPAALGACWDDECSQLAAARIGSVLGWTETQQRSELESFAEERRRFLHPVASASVVRDRESLFVEDTR
ncbi:MAG TPA: glycerol-3-phosphate dehydrogenase/oxidase [Terriglobales bacterium]|jgi:glycerol-3-phosphate dehydrogenase|nr:glycerol-3-phosphate dehydrogenase/oxidase [Terriglobales bacterium]